MDTDTALSVLLRRWRIALAGLLLTIIGVLYVLVDLGPIYKTTGSLVLVAPALPKAAAEANGDIGAENPLLGFSNALNIDANLVIKGLSDPTQVAAIQSKGGIASYKLEGSVDGITPLINVTASSRHPVAAEQTAKVVMSAAQRFLADRQAAVRAPADTLIHADVLTAPSPAKKSWSGRLKDLIIVILAGTVGTYLIALGRDRTATRPRAPETAAFRSHHDSVLEDRSHSGVELSNTESNRAELGAEEPMKWLSQFHEDVARVTVGTKTDARTDRPADSHPQSKPAQGSTNGHGVSPA
jgi:hypothetical protein